MQIRIRGDIAWKTFLDPKSGHWIGFCNSLKLTASGETYAELVAVMNESMNHVFKRVADAGDLEEFLKIHGWEKEEIPGGSEMDIDVPWTMTEADDSQVALHS